MPANLAGDAAPPRTGAFTLVEVLLAVILLGLLLGAAVFSFTSLEAGAKLDEGAARFETLLRFARAHAAQTGCKVQVAFDLLEAGTESEQGLARIRLTWEPDPLGQPGYFVPLQIGGLKQEDLNELIGVVSARLISMNPPQSTTAEVELEAPDTADEALPAHSLPAFTFHPDGSSDSAEIILASRDPEDLRQVSVRLLGITGGIRRQWIAATDE